MLGVISTKVFSGVIIGMIRLLGLGSTFCKLPVSLDGLVLSLESAFAITILGISIGVKEISNKKLLGL